MHTLTLTFNTIEELTAFISGRDASTATVQQITNKKDKKSTYPAADAPETKTDAVSTEDADKERVRLRAVVGEKTTAGHKDAVRDLLIKYGAKNVTTLDPIHFKDFGEKLAAIGA